MKIINIYYNFLAFQNNIIMNFLLILNVFFPTQMKNKLIHHKKKGDEYYKYILLLSLNNEIEEKYNINLLNIGINLYDKYKNFIININNDNDVISVVSDLSDLSDLSDYE